MNKKLKTSEKKSKKRKSLVRWVSAYTAELRSETTLPAKFERLLDTYPIEKMFKDKKVVIVGGGNSAVNDALHLKNIGVDVTVIHRRDTLRAQEHLGKSLDQNKISVIYDTQIREIKGKDRVEAIIIENTKTGKKKTMKVDGVFIAIGYEPAVDLAKKIGAEITTDGYIKHDSHHRTTVPCIYSASDVEGGYKQIVTAAGQGAEAALSIFEDLVNPYWKKKSGE